VIIADLELLLCETESELKISHYIKLSPQLPIFRSSLSSTAKHEGDFLNKFLKADDKVETKQNEAVEQDKRRKDTSLQRKLVFKDGKMGLDIKRWDEAVVEFCAETFCSFNAASRLDILLRALRELQGPGQVVPDSLQTCEPQGG
jgi:hypothetical protein